MSMIVKVKWKRPLNKRGTLTWEGNVENQGKKLVVSFGVEE